MANGTIRIELAEPCDKHMDLLSCPYFSDHQPYGPADWLRCPALKAAFDCPICDYDSYDMRLRRIMVVRRVGIRVGAGPDRRDPGIEFSCGCTVM